MRKTIIKSLVCFCLMIAMVSSYAFLIPAAEENGAAIETEAVREEQVEAETALQGADTVIAEEINISADEDAAEESDTEENTSESEENAAPAEDKYEAVDKAEAEDKSEAADKAEAEPETVSESETEAETADDEADEAADEETAEDEADEEDAELEVAEVLYSINGVSLPLKNYEAGKAWSAGTAYRGGIGCWAFALMVYEKIWAGKYSGTYGFTSARNTSDNMLRNYDARSSLMTITPEHAKDYISAASLGAVIRVCDRPDLSSDGEGSYMHSMILVQKDSEGFTVYHGNWNGKILFSYYTWKSFSDTFKNYKYFKYIKWPGAPAYKIIVYPAQVSIDTIKLTVNGVSLIWGKAADADSYIIERRVSGGSSWTELKSGYTGTSFEDTTAISGIKYDYSVTGYNKSSGKKGKSSTATIMFLSAPKDVVVTNVTNGINLKWSAITGADGYIVYRKTAGGAYSPLKKVTNVTYTDTSAVSGVEYYYTVKAYNNEAGQRSHHISAGFRGCYLAAPILSYTGLTSGIKVSWNAVPGADSYRVYRRTASGSYVVIANRYTGTEYTDTTAQNGTMYYYAVRAYSKTHNIYSGYNTLKAILLKAPTVSVTAASGSVTVTWTKVTGAQGYRVYRRTAGGGWQVIKIITSASTRKYVDTSVQSGTTYYYTVRAYTQQTGKTVPGLYNPGVRIRAK